MCSYHAVSMQAAYRGLRHCRQAAVSVLGIICHLFRRSLAECLILHLLFFVTALEPSRHQALLSKRYNLLSCKRSRLLVEALLFSSLLPLFLGSCFFRRVGQRFICMEEWCIFAFDAFLKNYVILLNYWAIFWILEGGLQLWFMLVFVAIMIERIIQLLLTKYVYVFVILLIWQIHFE